MVTKEERIQLRDELFDKLKELGVIIINKEFFSLRGKRIHILNNYTDLKQKYELYISQFRLKEEANYCLTHKDDFSNHICPVCGNICKFCSYKALKLYHKTCGKKECYDKLIHTEEAQEKKKQTMLKRYGVEHALQSKEVQEKFKQTCLKHYGVENVSKADIIKEKKKQTCLNHYGVEYSTQSDIMKNKSKQTMLERYGIEHPAQAEEFQDKMKKTMLERYGVEYTFQSKEVQKKSKQTCLDKYGVEYSMQSKEVQKKSKQTCLDKYGVEYSMQSKEVQKKSKQTCLDKYGVENPKQSPEVIKKLIPIKQLDDIFKTVFNGQNIDNVDVYTNDSYFTKAIEFMHSQYEKSLTLNDISYAFGISTKALHKKLKKLNLIQYVHIINPYFEKFVTKLLDEHKIKYETHNRNIIKPKELDFVLGNIAIEVNDIGSHNIEDKKINYHLNKTLKCKKKGYRLIHVWQWELTDKNLWDKLSNWIVNLCNNDKILVNVNDYNIDCISKKEEKKFLNKYHLDGYRKSDIALGLYYKNELIQVMSFTNDNKNNEYQMIRFCTKNGYKADMNILLNHFIKEYNPISIIACCNLDKFTGATYEENGFKLIETIEPQIISYKGDDSVPDSQKVYNCGYNLYKLDC